MSLTDPVSTSPAADSNNPFGNAAAAPDKPTGKAVPSGVVNADQQLFDGSDPAGPPAKEPKLIHAEYRTRASTTEHSKVRLVGATDETSPFDDPVDTDPHKAAAAPAEHPAAAHAAPHGAAPPTHLALSEGASRGPIDASQAPLVTVQWVKKSPLSVGQECACDLVIKNAGKVAAKKLAVEAYFPATVRLMRSEPMPADNQDHVTWSIPTLGAGEERIVHVTLVPAKRGELATSTLVRFTTQASNVFVVEEPMLSLAIHGPHELMVGDPAPQSITIGNPGTGIARNVTIEAHLSKGLEHPHGERLTIPVGSINPGESHVVRLPLVAVGGGPQTIALHASAAGDLHRELTTKINVIAPKLNVTAEGPNFRYVGCKAAYFVTITNDSAPSNNVHVTHTLPEGFRFVAADKGGEYDDTTRTVNWFIGHLDLKESVRLKVELATTEIGTHVHKFVAVAEQGSRRHETGNDCRRNGLTRDRDCRPKQPGRNRRRDRLRDSCPQRRHEGRRKRLRLLRAADCGRVAAGRGCDDGDAVGQRKRRPDVPSDFADRPGQDGHLPGLRQRTQSGQPPLPGALDGRLDQRAARV